MLSKFSLFFHRELNAKILINGKLSGLIKILRGIKQGDALSCLIFIICIDPLIRNIIANRQIQIVDIRTRLTGLEIKAKAGGFADDVWVLCRNDNRSIQGIFTEYDRLTRRSGLTLNANKTEILNVYDGNNDR